jgi:hypothetical protein
MGPPGGRQVSAASGRGCRCRRCVKANADYLVSYRAARDADSRSGHASRVRPREPAPIGAASIRTTEPAPQPVSASVAAARPGDTTGPDDSGEWAAGLWEEFAEALGIIDSLPGRPVRIWPLPNSDIAELTELAEAWSEQEPDYGLCWQRVSRGSLFSKEYGLEIWIERLEPITRPEPIARTPAGPEIRYQFSPAGYGHCELWPDGENQCGIGVDGRLLVSGHPVCKRHYDAVHKDYPERCKYIRPTYADTNATWPSLTF